jgi:hypothetical protein
MILGILTLITALSISAVAIYYSVAGLVAIFAAAAVPIMIMGTTLEVAKLVTAVWLHHYWNEAKWWLKGYLSVSVVVLMLITSMGIFGFLSKAHIEQTANATEGLAQIERIDTDVARQLEIIQRAEQRISDIESKGSNNDAELQAKIDAEQTRIDSAYDRIQPAIDEQLEIIAKAEQALENRIEPLLAQASTIGNALTNLNLALTNNEITIAQGIVGAKQDGSLGPSTSARIQEYRNTEESKRNELLNQADQIRTTPQTDVQAARNEIARLRSIAEQQIADSDKLIARLREQLGTEDIQAIANSVNEQQNIIVQANTNIDTLEEQKYTLQIEYRKLEAEVGPVKYLAEFIYGQSANDNLLEEAVRWVILIIIFVFDPLAVLLLIASQQTFEIRRESKLRAKAALVAEENQRIQLKKEETDKKIQAIISRNNYLQEEKQNDQSLNSSDEHELSAPAESSDEYSSGAAGGADKENNTDEIVHITTGAQYNGGDSSSRMDDNETQRHQELELLEQDEGYKNAKQDWKSLNPDQNIKFWKDQYIKGKIDELPWVSYVQNSEQSPNSLWNRIRSKDE